MNRRPKKITWILLGVLLLLCAWLLQTTPDDAASPENNPSNHTTLTPAFEPSPTESANTNTRNPGHNIAAIRKLLYQSNQQLQVTRRADGSRHVRLQGQHQHASAAKRLPDGTLVISCFENVDSMLEFMDQPTTPGPDTHPTLEVAER